MATIDQAAAARWLGKVYAVPPNLIKDAPIPINILDQEALNTLGTLIPGDEVEVLDGGQ